MSNESSRGLTTGQGDGLADPKRGVRDLRQSTVSPVPRRSSTPEGVSKVIEGIVAEVVTLPATKTQTAICETVSAIMTGETNRPEGPSTSSIDPVPVSSSPSDLNSPASPVLLAAKRFSAAVDAFVQASSEIAAGLNDHRVHVPVWVNISTEPCDPVDRAAVGWAVGWYRLERGEWGFGRAMVYEQGQGFRRGHGIPFSQLSLQARIEVCKHIPSLIAEMTQRLNEDAADLQKAAASLQTFAADLGLSKKPESKEGR